MAMAKKVQTGVAPHGAYPLSPKGKLPLSQAFGRSPHPLLSPLARMALGLSGALAETADLNAQDTMGKGPDVADSAQDGVLVSDAPLDAPLGPQHSSVQSGRAQLLADLQGGGEPTLHDDEATSRVDSAGSDVDGLAMEALLDAYADQTEQFAMADLPKPVANVSAPAPIAAPAAAWAVPPMVAPATSAAAPDPGQDRGI